MFGKYFKHILVLTLLAGTAYSLPQVKDAMVGAFSFPGSNEAMIINYTGPSSTINRIEGRADMNRPPLVREQVIMQVPPRNMIPPEEVVAILFKAGVISKEKLPLALRVIREHASSTKIISPFNASTTPPFSSTTKPMMRDIRDLNRDMRPISIPAERLDGQPAALEDVKIEAI